MKPVLPERNADADALLVAEVTVRDVVDIDPHSDRHSAEIAHAVDLYDPSRGEGESAFRARNRRFIAVGDVTVRAAAPYRDP